MGLTDGRRCWNRLGPKSHSLIKVAAQGSPGLARAGKLTKAVPACPSPPCASQSHVLALGLGGPSFLPTSVGHCSGAHLQWEWDAGAGKQHKEPSGVGQLPPPHPLLPFSHSPVRTSTSQHTRPTL